MKKSIKNDYILVAVDKKHLGAHFTPGYPIPPNRTTINAQPRSIEETSFIVVNSILTNFKSFVTSNVNGFFVAGGIFSTPRLFEYKEKQTTNTIISIVCRLYFNFFKLT